MANNHKSKRIKDLVDRNIDENQFDVSKGNGTKVAIFTLKIALEGRLH